jgi:hypothetical protein
MPARRAEVLGRRRGVSVSRRDDGTAHRTARYPETTRGIAPCKTGGSVMMRTFGAVGIVFCLDKWRVIH